MITLFQKFFVVKMTSVVVNRSILIAIILISLLVFKVIAQSRDSLGDVNDDGVINVLDIVRIVNIILENEPLPTEYELWAGDVNSDGQIDIADVVILVQVIMENDDCPYLYSPCSYNLSICCPDTTSHDVYWQFDTLGSPGSWGYLKDIAVLDTNNIWVTGDIRIENDIGFAHYNAAHWNGEDWELLQLFYTGYPIGSYPETILPGNVIFAFDENNIYATAGNLFHWDGETWREIETPIVTSGTVMNMWGSPSGDLYIVGDNGTFVHYNGEEFIPIETNTSVDFISVWGTSSDNVWVCGNNYPGYNLTGIYHWDGVNLHTISVYTIQYWDEPYADTLSGAISGVYTDDPDSAWVVTSYGMYRISVDSQGEGELVNGWTDWVAAMKDIEGNNHHDMFIGGAFAIVWHYNGFDFHMYEELSNLEGLYDITGVSVKGNTVGLAGFLLSTSQGFVIRGYRE